MADGATDVMWTGGSDSTFRVLDLVLRCKCVVQPVYVLDDRRRGTGYEINAMLGIRRTLGARAPDAALRLLPTIYRDRAAIRSDPVAVERFAVLGRRGPIGMQYRWLAELAKREGLDVLELAVHRDDRAFFFIAGQTVGVPGSAGDVRALRDDNPDDALELFRPFRFPLLDWSKPRMYSHAEAHGFADLLDLPWFCHSPRNARPCGKMPPPPFRHGRGNVPTRPFESRVVYRLFRLKGLLRDRGLLLPRRR